MEPRENFQKAIQLPTYIPQFDGLRGIAILSVLLAHAEFLRVFVPFDALQYGRLGVDLFFVLSGFLITKILLDSKYSDHYLRNFYIRRILRIWPLYYAVLLMAFAIIPAVDHSVGFSSSKTIAAFVLYIQNVVREINIPEGLTPTWSLAIEEQFYLTWPLIVLFLPRRFLKFVLLFLIAISIGLRIYAFKHGSDLRFIHNFTLCRLDAIAAGCLSALGISSKEITLTSWRKSSLLAIVSAVLGIGLARFLWHEQSTVISYAFFAMGFAGILGIALISNPGKSISGRILTIQPLCYIGKISYGIYLVHMPLFILFKNLFQQKEFILKHTISGRLLVVFAQFCSAILVASISWRFFESPIQKLKSHFPSSARLQRPTEEP